MNSIKTLSRRIHQTNTASRNTSKSNENAGESGSFDMFPPSFSLFKSKEQLQQVAA